MNIKIISIAGIMFALTFIAIFMVVFNSGSDLLGNTFNEYFSNQKEVSMLDIDYLDGKVVTADTIQNIKKFIGVYEVYEPALADIVISKYGVASTYKVNVIKTDGKVTKIEFTAV